MHPKEKHIILTESERFTLQEGSDHHPKSEFRKKCHGLLLNHAGLSRVAVAAYLGVGSNTLASWIKSWEKSGVVGLLRKKGQGCKLILQVTNVAHVQALGKAVEKHYQDVKSIQAELVKELQTSMSEDTVKRFLKKRLFMASCPSLHPSRAKPSSV